MGKTNGSSLAGKRSRWWQREPSNDEAADSVSVAVGFVCLAISLERCADSGWPQPPSRIALPELFLSCGWGSRSQGVIGGRGAYRGVNSTSEISRRNSRNLVRRQGP